MTKDRKFIRVDLEALSNIKTKAISAQFQEELEHQILNIGLGGIFVETGSPLPNGTFFEFEFTLPSSDQQVQAKGMVTWVSRKHPKGMGIKFIRISTIDKKSILIYINRRLKEKGIPLADYDLAELEEVVNEASGQLGFDEIISTELGEAVLKIYFKEIGFDMELDKAVEEANCSASELSAVLEIFDKMGLVKIEGTLINFYYAEEQTLRNSIENWIRANAT